MIDAVSYLALGRVFTANMTGNVVLLGFGIAGTGGLPVLAPVISLVSFAVGSRFGGMLAASVGDRHGRHVGSALAIEAALVGIAAVVLGVAGVHPDSFSADAVITLLAQGMGVRNATVRKLAVPDLTTTVLTSTLTGLAAEFSLRRGSPAATSTARRTAAVGTMLAGALGGALLVRSSAALTLAAVAALVLVCLLAGCRHAGEPPRKLLRLGPCQTRTTLPSCARCRRSGPRRSANWLSAAMMTRSSAHTRGAPRRPNT